MQATEQGHIFSRDGTRIAYEVFGKTGRALVCTNGYATSSFYWNHIIEHFSPRYRVVTWDLKGHGASDPAHSLDHCTIEDSSDDLHRVLGKLGIERGVLLGFSLGCQIIFEGWRHYPDRISALIPILGTYGRPFDELVNPTVGRVASRLLKHLGPTIGPASLRTTGRIGRSRFGHGLNQRGGFIGRRVSRERMRPFYDHLGRIHGRTWVAMGVAAQDHTAEDLLESISVPVLAISGGRDIMTPAVQGKRMRDRIPDCTLVTLPEATHTGLWEFPDRIIEELENFLTSHDLTPA